MGIYDRDYYRERAGGWHSWDGHQVTYGLIAVTVGVFFAQAFSRPAGDPVGHWGAFHYADVVRGEVWRLVTAHFVHSPGRAGESLIGVALGMWALWMFGSALEGVYGPREFLAFYLGASLAITGAATALGLAGVARGGTYFGCGGVLTAVLVLFACHFPAHRILLFFILPVPAWLLAAGIVVFALFASIDPDSGPTPTLVAAAFAFAYHRSGIRLTAWLPRLGGWAAARRQPRLRIAAEPRESVAAGAAAPSRAAAAAPPANPAVDEQLEAKLDNVLEKVSRFGRGSLTAEEQAILQRASEIYKRRRGT